MTIRGIWQFSWTVESLDRALEFYVDGLGFALRHQQLQDNPYTRQLVGYPDAVLRMAQLNIPGWDPGISGHVLELTEYQSPKPDTLNSRDTYNIGVAHLALVVDDIEEIHQRVVDHGGRPLSSPVAIAEGINRGGYAFYARDPDGFTLEFVQPPAWSSPRERRGRTGPEAAR